MTKPTFLDCPPRYTRTADRYQSPADYASPVERPRNRAGDVLKSIALAVGLGFAFALIMVVELSK